MAAPYIPLSADTTLVAFQRTKVAHAFPVGAVVYVDNSGVWQLARSNNLATLGQAMVAAVVSADIFRLAMEGEVVSGFSGLTVGQPVHTSAATAGAVATAAQGVAPANAVAQNPIGTALSATTVQFNFGTPSAV
jgi:hypothetical protein